MSDASLPELRSNPVLVVIADPAIRKVVDDTLQSMELPAILTATWRQAIVATTGAPSCIVADLDDIGDKTAGMAALRRSWGDVPLIVLSTRPDVVEQAVAVRALAAIRQPINVGALMQAIRRAVTAERWET